MSTIMQASEQWRSRPADQRFVSLIDLNTHLQYVHANSRASTVSSRALACTPVEGAGHNALQVIDQSGEASNLTHWSFGQLAQRAGAPAGYLRDLPAPLAADCVNYGLHVSRDLSDLGVLRYQNGGPPELRAVTGSGYGRVWNSTISQSLVDRFGDGITGDFRVPGEFGRHVDVTKANTTLYASDRDMFVFLADETNRIEVPNRRDGQSGLMARGFFVWNSEVGASTFGVATFLFDYVCCNRIVWGATEHKEIRIRHTASAPDRWIEEVAPAIEHYAQSSTGNIVAAIAAAKASKIDKIEDFLAKRFTRKIVSGVVAAHMADEQRPIESLWDAATGITAYARSVPYQDERVQLEREAGRILDMAA